MIQVSMTPSQFAVKAAELKRKKGVELTGKEGTISSDGVTASYGYDGSTLTVTVTKSPFLLSKVKCESMLRGWLTV